MTARASRRSADQGFTLIELAVVILIIGILLAVAIPTFLGVRKSAQNKAAQSSVRNALTNAKALAADDGTYANLEFTALQAAAPEIRIAPDASTKPTDVSVDIDRATGEIVLVARAQTGECFWLHDSLDDSGAVATGQFGRTTGGPACLAHASSGGGGTLPQWKDKW